MFKYFLLFGVLCCGLYAYAFECNNYNGICLATQSNKIYQPVVKKINKPSGPYVNGKQIVQTTTFYDYQLAAANSCKQIDGRLPNNEELLSIAEFFKSVPVKGKQVYFWSSEKESDTEGYALRYDGRDMRFINVISGYNVSRSNWIEALCVK